MTRRSGQIVAIRDGVATIRVERAAACSSCGTRSLCGAGKADSSLLTLPVLAGAQAGDRISLNLPAGMLARAALLAYLLPAVTTVCGAALFSGTGDFAAVLGALGGLGAGLVLLRFFGRRQAACDHLTMDSQPLGEAP